MTELRRRLTTVLRSALVLATTTSSACVSGSIGASSRRALPATSPSAAAYNAGWDDGERTHPPRILFTAAGGALGTALVLQRTTNHTNTKWGVPVGFMAGATVAATGNAMRGPALPSDVYRLRPGFDDPNLWYRYQNGYRDAVANQRRQERNAAAAITAGTWVLWAIYNALPKPDPHSTVPPSSTTSRVLGAPRR